MVPPTAPMKQFSYELEGTATATHGAVRMGHLKSGFTPDMTLYKNLHEFRRKFDPNGTNKLFGWRKTDPVTGKPGEFEWVTLIDFLPVVEAAASGMSHILKLQRGAIVGVFAKNCYQWSIVEHSASRMAYTLVPLYDTLGPAAIPFILNHTEMSVVFCGKEQFKTLMGVVHECPSVKTVVKFEDDIDEEETVLAKEHKVKLMTLGQLIEDGKNNVVPADPPLPSDLATICYTSGTTGDPKGVMLTHANMMAAAACAFDFTLILPTDIHLSYLPLAHCFERVIQTTLIYNGAAVGYYSGDVKLLMDDLGALQPTVFPSVPRLLNRIHDKISQGAAEAGGIKKWLFDTAYASKKYYLKDGYKTHAFWDFLVFSKAKRALGGRVRRMMNGSAPLSKEVKEFCQIVFGATMLEGYGLTETGAVISCSTDEIPPGDHIGIPLGNVQICLEDVPEMNYTSHDTPCPRGEILMKGDNLFIGYYKQPDLTKEAIDADGWLHTGDIGCWNPDGTLRIIDRKKNIFKLSQGEYVAPEKIEGIYIKSPLIAQAFVHGDSLKSYLVGIIVPDAEIVAKWAKDKGLEASFEELCVPGSPAGTELKADIAREMERLATEYKLFGFERVKKFHVQAEQFTPENDFATPTFKLKRPLIVKHFGPELEGMYTE
ncbi:putative long-chain-fatty-acid-CoA ligase [Phytophthora cinnamomi]|uniref:putative long-chain-fatty-acid-CoA ligase n=1 Tax=Phytophthora cinnamomi TaxID=4785 RepID=UPI00355AACDB|nr:putative long-chain-fatty-acid-CoA ligase [Phytophthora cinnamomi]